MRKRMLTLVLSACAVVATACGSDGALGPKEVPVLNEPEASVLSELRIRPAEVLLFTTGPSNTVQLFVEAYDQQGRLMPEPGTPRYVSSAPAAAEVSRSGLVTAVAPGSAEITATLIVGGVTKTASTAVSVFERAAPPPAVDGVYDLTATVTGFDPVWGDLTGFRYTGILTLRSDSSGAAGISGTYSDFRGTSLDGETVLTGGDGSGTGSITSSFDPLDGSVVIELVGVDFHFDLFLVGNSLAGDSPPEVIEGTFFTGGHITGTFSAQRRS